MKLFKYIKNIIDKHEIIRFMAVGGCAACIHYGVYWSLFILNAPYNVAYSAGFITSLAFNFFASNYFTFRTKPTKARAVKFCMGHGFNFLVQLLIFNTLIWFKIPPEIAPIITFVLAFPIGFLLIRFALKGQVRVLVNKIIKKIADSEDEE